MNERAAVEMAVRAGVATVAAACPNARLLPALRRYGSRRAFAGYAFTAECSGGDNLRLHEAIACAQPFDVILAAVYGDPDYAYWGELMTAAAQARSVCAALIDGGIRDVNHIAARGFPICARGIAQRDTAKDEQRPGAVGVPVLFASVVIRPGDLIVSDADGIVVLARSELVTLERAVRRTQLEDAALAEIAGGLGVVAALARVRTQSGESS